MKTNETWMLLVPIAVSLLVVTARASGQSQVPFNLDPVPHLLRPPGGGSANTLEIPLVLSPNQPDVDPSFVGNWCGTLALKLGATQAQHSRLDCITFSGAGKNVAIETALVLPPTSKNITVQPISSFAYAEGADGCP